MATKFAVIKTGGKQYKVEEGRSYKFEKLDAENGSKVSFDTLLVATSDGEQVEIGRPSLGEKVEGVALGNGKAKKVTVVKYKNKTRYLRTKGHRQPFSQIKITKIAA